MPSQDEHVEIVERWVAGYRDRNLEQMQAVADPEIELRMPTGDVLSGYDGLAAMTRHGWEAETPHYPNLDRCILKHDTVFALIDVELRSPETGEAVRTLAVGAEFRIRDGLVVEWAGRPDRAKLLEDAEG
ncbi:MAG: nuclear transport factor 2 family protein [Solirubrobacterales bacterium]|nr:nuclear transport factor 2 family protein [Solirubrobacterales bacterium]